jgi:hypothetical protein
LMGPSNRQGASMRSLRKAARKVASLPLVVRDLVDEPLAPRRPAAQAGHIGLGPGFIDEDQPPGDDRDIGEALVDSDIGYVCNSELVGPVNRQLSGSIGIDRLIMIAVGRRDVTAPPAWLKVVLAHQASDFLVIDDHAATPQLGANASPAIEFELVADCRDRLDDRRIVMHGGR